MTEKKTARRCCNTYRASVHAKTDADIVTHPSGYDEACRVIGWVIGIAFGLMLFLGILGG